MRPGPSRLCSLESSYTTVLLVCRCMYLYSIIVLGQTVTCTYCYLVVCRRVICVVYLVLRKQWLTRRERERERESTRPEIRLCRDPRSVGIRALIPRVAATLQLVAGTGWKLPVLRATAVPPQLLMEAWPLVQLDVRPSVTDRTPIYGPVAWPG